MDSFYSNGKLLLTGEYLVLDGALALAVPTKFGQSLQVKPSEEKKIAWNSYGENDELWFSGKFDAETLSLVSSRASDTKSMLPEALEGKKISNRLTEILQATKQLNPNFLKSGFEIKTTVNFPRDWGLGTSSTLINNIANWAEIDAYKLLEQTFGGSGYDIACAQNNHPITYQLLQGKPSVNSVEFNPEFKDHLFFVYLNKKQNSREGISQYRLQKKVDLNTIEEISTITSEIISCNTLTDFNKLIMAHETIISKVIKQKPIKEHLFNDFNGSIKSLGAWGGDFILAASSQNPKHYFKNKGFETIISFEDMILQE